MTVPAATGELIPLDVLASSEPGEQPARKSERRHLSAVQPCPNANSFSRRCKSPTCPSCGPIWAGDQRRVIEEGLRSYGGQVVLTDVTPPGAERIPWACTRDHQHSGPKGCRVQQRSARDWCDTYTQRLDSLRRAGDSFVRRRICECGHTRRNHERLPGRRAGACDCGACTCQKFKGIAPKRLTRVHEPQKRGVPHCHPAFGFETLAEQRAARLWVAWARQEEKCSCGRTRRWHDAGGACPVPEEQRSPTFGWTRLRQYDFGFVEGHLTPIGPAEAARYLASYLTGRSKHKPQMRQNVVDPAMTYWAVRDAAARGGWDEPKQRRYRIPLVWVSPKLTNIRTGSGFTMRMLRRTNLLWAVLKGRYRDADDNPAPKWFYEVPDALEAALVFRRQRRRDKPDVANAIAELVFDVIDRYVKTPPGMQKVLQRREAMQFVRVIAEVRPDGEATATPMSEIAVPVAA